jgi:C-terminal processing protease CtpA/Prc
LTIEGFPPSDEDEAREAIAAQMSEVAGADALLIDLRENHGGRPDTVALVASYLFDAAPVHLNDMYLRDSASTKQYWTVRDLRGTRYGGKKPVYVLTSHRTFSGGEELAYDLQCLHRAQVVGETTGGGANPGDFRELDDWFRVFVPNGRPINPITKTNWEGVGVAPDIPVSADAALDEAHRRALRDLSGTNPR